MTTHNHNTNRESGFTLIEVLIAVALLGILAAIAIPHYNRSREVGIATGVESIAHATAGGLALEIAISTYVPAELPDYLAPSIRGDWEYERQNEGTSYCLSITRSDFGASVTRYVTGTGDDYTVSEVNCLASAGDHLPAPLVTAEVTGNDTGNWHNAASATVRVGWYAVPGATEYEVERNGVSIMVTTDTRYDDTIYDAGKTQSLYRVRAIDAKGAGPWSDIAATKTMDRQVRNHPGLVGLDSVVDRGDGTVSANILFSTANNAYEYMITTITEVEGGDTIFAQTFTAGEASGHQGLVLSASPVVLAKGASIAIVGCNDLGCGPISYPITVPSS